ncbi:hypothetical protein EUTSA_v10026875mg [Eutrema salsugineum]|uniref:DUF295 domain-containing protein n=1 Tax=Eutrema salsugineum TaxID=72664 RepID=V4ME20_EUTSA|nr:hypothetical protein EUTSA_v10026875mg [Eutrema salsugineum]
MSQLIINRLLKPNLCKNVLRRKNVRLFSTPAYPYLLIDHILNNTACGLEESDAGRRFTLSSESYHPPHLKEKMINLRDQELVDEVRHAMTLGFHNAKPVSVDLPPLPTGSRIQNLAMSSRPDLNNKDWVVAVKFSGSQLRLYRPACDDGFRWLDINTTPESINPFSSLMYSKKDERFYIPSPGCEYLCSLDVHFKEGDMLEFPLMWTAEHPKPRELNPLLSFFRTDHLVESPSGDKFLVKW